MNDVIPVIMLLLPLLEGVPYKKEKTFKCFNASSHSQSSTAKKITYRIIWVAVISAKNHKRQSVTTKREKSQTPEVLTAILT